MKKILIIGSGLAGLSSAVSLINKGFDVTIIEKNNNLGGRATSFYNESTQEWIDIGQHLMLGCYKNTLKFLKKIGSLDKIKLQKGLSVVFVDKGKKIFRLKSITRLYPFNLLLAILNFRAVKLFVRMKILTSILGLIFKKKHSDLSVDDWLKRTKQTETAISVFWAPLCIGIMNSNPENASMNIFKNALKEIFFKGNKASSFVEQKVSLKELFIEPAVEFIKNNGGNILKEKVKKIIAKKNVITEIITDKNNYSDFDYIISTVTPDDLYEILPDKNKSDVLKEIKYNPIITAHFWLNENPFKEKFYGLIDSKIHWVFNHNSYISIVVSAARELVNLSNEEIYEMFCSELKKYFNDFSENVITDYKIIKEKKATVIQTPDFVKFKENFKSPYKNFFILGDWTDKYLPATIENAVIDKNILSEVL